jgi:hypothetical protein
MNQEIHVDYAGYAIIATGIQSIDRSWRCAFIILESGRALLSACTVTPFTSRDEAEQNGIAIAVRIVDGEVADMPE